MIWRNLVAKYSLFFLTTFIILYTFLVTTIYNYQKNQLIIVADQQLNQTSSQIMTYVNTQLAGLRLTLISVGILVVILFIVFSYLLSRRITTTLSEMTNSTQQIIAGRYDIKLPIQSHDELGEFAMSFNRMSRQLGNQFSILLQEKEILYSIIRSMKDGVMTLNLDGTVIISNTQADSFMADLTFEHDQSNELTFPDAFNHFFQSVIEKGSAQNFHTTVQGRNWDIVCTPLHKNDKIQGAVAIFRDITEEQQLNQLRETFIANVSHELRTPISLIHGYSEAIIDQVTDTVLEQRELAKVIYEESERMGRLISELLDLTKLKSGHLDLEIKEHMLTPFLDKIERKFTNSFKQNQLVFTKKIDDKMTVCRFDYDRLEQVLTNLIDNAIKHTPAEGEITLKVTKERKKVAFSLHDTGVGIEKEDLPFVFERFYMADKSRSNLDKAKKGTGLGLAIVKQIVEAHDGEINVRSKREEGTTFRFTLPIKNEH